MIYVIPLFFQDRDSYWRMMQKYIGSDITSMVTLPVLIFEPMTMLQKMAEVYVNCFFNCISGSSFSIWCWGNLQIIEHLLQLMEYSYLLDMADECEDPQMRLVYAGKHSFASLSPSLFCVCGGLYCDLGLTLAGCSIIFYICLLCAPKNLEAI